MLPLKFKWYETNEDGQRIGTFGKKGVLASTELKLGKKLSIPVEAISGAFGEVNVVVIAYDVSRDFEATKTIFLARNKVRKTVDAINQLASQNNADKHYRQLVRAGFDGPLRSKTCPNCESIIDLTARQKTFKSWCSYCDRICNTDAGQIEEESDLRCCEECGFYSHPKEFTWLFIYFFFVIFGYSYSQKYLCNTCARRSAWKMLAANFLFVIGIVPSIGQLLRAYLGGSKFKKDFKELDAANRAAQKGKWQDAERGYQAILSRNPNQSGIHLNRGHAFMEAKKLNNAVAAYTESIKSCGNYLTGLEALGVAMQRNNTPDEFEKWIDWFLGPDKVLDDSELDDDNKLSPYGSTSQPST